MIAAGTGQHEFLSIMLAHCAEVDKADEVRVAKFNPYLIVEYFRSLSFCIVALVMGHVSCVVISITLVLIRMG